MKLTKFDVYIIAQVLGSNYNKCMEEFLFRGTAYQQKCLLSSHASKPTQRHYYFKKL